MRTKEEYGWYQLLINPTGGNTVSTLSSPAAVEVPTRIRKRLFSSEFVDAVVELVQAGKAAKYGEYEPGSHLSRKSGNDITEQHARSEGIVLAREVEEKTGTKYGVSVWVDGNGKIIGALLAREAKKITAKSGGKSK